MRAIEVEYEMTEDQFIEELDEIYGQVDICGYKYSSGRALLELDPIAFRCGKSDSEASHEVEEWECSNCHKTYDNESEAEDCCLVECKECEQKLPPNEVDSGGLCDTCSINKRENESNKTEGIE
jgi:hypothetical protein